MSRKIKFTSFGVPYVPEFENVSFAPEQPRRSPSPSSSISSFCYIDSPPTPPRRPSLRSPFKRKPIPPHHALPTATSSNSVSEPLPRCAKTTKPPPFSDVNGICIRFPPECTVSAMSRKERLIHLQKTISVAVLGAGMSRSPGNTNPEKYSNGNGSRGYRTPDALFCGTYGQMMAALEDVGLSAAPCAGDSEDLPGYKRLGALFVAQDDGASGVQLRKITLWG